MSRRVIQNNTNKSTKNPKLKTEFTCPENIKKNNILLNINKHDKNDSKNGDIMNYINDEKKIKFSNELIYNKLKQNMFNLRNLKFESFRQNYNKNIKKEIRAYNKEIKNFDNNDSYNNSLYLEDKYKNKDLTFLSLANCNSSSFKNVSSEKSLFEQKFNIEKNYLNEESALNIKEKNESMKIIHSDIFHKDIEEIKNENKSKNFDKILLSKKMLLKKKKTIKEKCFKDFIKEENYEENVGTIDKGFNENNLIKRNIIKIEDNVELIEEEWQNKINNVKKYMERLKSLSREEFIKDTLKYIKCY